MEFEPKSHVYIKVDDQCRITRCEGGYTTPADLTDWVEIDEGTGDRYNLCQSHYFEGGLYTMDGIPRYKLEDGYPVRRTGEEIEAERATKNILAPIQLREQAYNTEAIISWSGEMITVTQAAQLWQYYAAEGNGKANELQTLIAEAKASIREKYPDEE